MKSVCDKIKSNLLQQNVYVLHQTPAFDEKKDYLQSTYMSHDVVLENGAMSDRIHEEPYPITPESVNSHASSCDYKQDPVSAVSRGISRPNLGDVTAAVDLLHMDKAELDAYVKSLQERVIQAQKQKNDSVKEGENNV